MFIKLSLLLQLVVDLFEGNQKSVNVIGASVLTQYNSRLKLIYLEWPLINNNWNIE